MGAITDLIKHTLQTIMNTFAKIFKVFILYYISFKAKKLLGLVSAITIDGVLYNVYGRAENGDFKLSNLKEGVTTITQDIIYNTILNVLKKQSNHIFLNDKEAHIMALNIIKEKSNKPLSDFLNVKDKKVTIDYKTM